jgi:hypothetical protein
VPRNPNAAVIAVRLAPQLKAALQEAAGRAGCSLNAYAVQVLASAAGDPARFRVEQLEPTVDERREHLRALPRNHYGYPDSLGERMRHCEARNAFIEHFDTTGAFNEGMAWAQALDLQRPWHYVEWAEFNGPLLPEDLEPARRPVAS